MYRFFFGLLTGSAAALFLTRPARLRDVALLGVRPRADAQGVRAAIAWKYGPGARPVSLIVDLEAEDGVHGSATADLEQREVLVPLPTAPTKPYTITTTATYRIMGIPRVQVLRF